MALVYGVTTALLIATLSLQLLPEIQALIDSAGSRAPSATIVFGFPVSLEQLYVLFVMAGGALGSCVLVLISIASSVSGARFPRGWIASSLLHTAVSIPLALGVYIFIRGALVSSGLSAAVLNPYGILIASTLVGLFATPLMNRLGAITFALAGSTVRVERQINDIGAALGVAALANYRGYICVAYQDSAGELRLPTGSTTGGTAPATDLLANETYSVVVWFQVQREPKFSSEEIRIDEGSDSPQVEFQVSPTSDSVFVRPRQQTVRFDARDSSPRLPFMFRTPAEPDKYEIWFEVSQKNRLVHVVTSSYEVRGGPSPSTQSGTTSPPQSTTLPG